MLYNHKMTTSLHNDMDDFFSHNVERKKTDTPQNTVYFHFHKVHKEAK